MCVFFFTLWFKAIYVTLNSTVLFYNARKLLFLLLKFVIIIFSFPVYPSVDHCYKYTVLDNPWRANSSQRSNPFMKCDTSVTWRGWYRLFINGLNAQIPDTCVAQYSCGTVFPLWIRGGHPTVEDGVVTRDVCGYTGSYCCYYGSYPIKVKACPGNYYVYELVKPAFCYSAYCAGDYIHIRLLYYLFIDLLIYS